jgi:hypothetical protein
MMGGNKSGGQAYMSVPSGGGKGCSRDVQTRADKNKHKRQMSAGTYEWKKDKINRTHQAPSWIEFMSRRESTRSQGDRKEEIYQP